MATPAPFRLSLDDGTGPQILQSAPSKWEDVEVKTARNKTYFGIMREYSNNYEFVKDAARILRTIYYTQGGEGKCKLKIERREDLNWTYDDLIEGDLDFTRSSDTRDSFSIQMMEAGAVALIKANENTEYEIPIDGTEVVTADIDAMLIQGEARWISSWPVPTIANTPIPTAGNTIYYFLLDDTMFNDVNGPPAYAVTQEFEHVAAGAAMYGNHLLQARKNIYDLFFTGKITVYVENTSGSSMSWNLHYEIINAANTSIITNHVLFTGTVPAHSNATFTDISLDAGPFNLAPGEKILLAFAPPPFTTNCNVKWDKDFYLKALFKNYASPFSVKGLRGIDVFTRLISKMTDGQYAGDSDLLSNPAGPYNYDNRPYDTLWTSGDAVRGAVTSGSTVPVIKIKLSDFYKACHVVWGAGMSIENDVARVEPMSRYFDPLTVIATLDRVASVKVDHAQDLVYNKMNIGYEPQDYDELNGRDEYNTTQVRSFPVAKQAELDMVSPVRADGYGLFFTWVKYAQSDTTDSESDNSVFLLEIEHTPQTSGHYKALHLAGTRTGVIDPAYTLNYGLSPMRCLLRNGPYIHSLLFRLDAGLIRFQTTDKNAAMQSTLLSGLIDEDADVVIGNLAAPLFQPMLFTVQAVSEVNLLPLLNALPYGVIRFPYRGSYFDGFIMSAGVKPAHPTSYEFVLLSSPLNDLTRLIE